ncbi:MAG: hypothetical protein HUK14_09565 [Muribaculaceae bacterium]|nr:hypothetical protein [Muribaculaceae bacterium]
MKLYKSLFVGALICSVVASCSEKQPFETAGPDDEPHILAPTFPDREKGELPIVANQYRDQNFQMEVTVTPSAYTTVKWFLDDKEVFEGNAIDMPLLAGGYNLKIVATTQKGKTATREGIIIINSYEGDPIGEERDAERVVIVGANAVLYGQYLSRVKNMLIDDVPVVAMEVISDEEIHYVVPEVSDGMHRVVFVAEDGQQYGGGKVFVSSTAVVTGGAEVLSIRAKATLTGYALDQVESLTLGNAAIANFEVIDANTLVFTVPEMEEGEYKMTGTTKNGSPVNFYEGAELVTEKTVRLSSLRVLWAGMHYVSWELEDGNPNKTFNLIPQEEILALPVGSTLFIKYELKSDDAYHQQRVTTGWWTDLPGGAQIDLYEDGIREVVITQEALDMMAEQAGFLVVGHGFYVTEVAVQ